MAKLYVFAFAILFTCGSVIGQDDTTLAPVPDTTIIPDVPTTLPPPTEPPTVEPDTTTAEPEPETTLPPEPETTTAAPVPDTTTAPPAPVTTPAPEADYNYNITENNVTCIMIEGDVSFVVNYTAGNDTQIATITLPKHPMASTLISGTCNGTEGQENIKVTWGSTEQSNSVNLEFSQKADSWSIASFTANLFMDPKIFANGTDAGKTLSLVVDYGFSPLSVPVNHSYNCHSSLSAVNITATIGDEPYTLGVSSKLEGIHIQAFNMVPNEPDFVSSVHCSADEISDVVPIAVGCALAALVVIVLIAYLVGRRRRSAAYQSV
ncbi:lysosome-associated membrane glycoprotein 1-like [Palaemon carinicauda]|uniref:lysosome-associated membrane glycoprotein 1-like n=1 Tax=Palaemon carinicauda TaxID=392227 RepID=UPI0035B5EAAA